MKLDGKRIVIVGGTSGIGLAVAQGAIAEGADVVVGSSQTAKVETAARQLGNRASGHAVNVREQDSVAAFFGEIGPFDHLVFTAGDWGAAGLNRPTIDEPDRAADIFAVRLGRAGGDPAQPRPDSRRRLDHADQRHGGAPASKGRGAVDRDGGWD